MPKLSILMPCKNLNLKSEMAINSLLSQDIDMELIIVVDGGENNLKINDNRVKINVLKSNIGPGPAVNIAYSIASGEYITVHDDDDYSVPERFTMLFGALEENRIITSNIMQTQGDKSGIIRFNTSSFCKPTRLKPPAHHCATIIRRDLWDKIGPYHNCVISDSIRMIKLGIYLKLKNENFLLCDKPLYNYIVGDGLSQSVSWKSLVKSSRRRLFRSYSDILNMQPENFLKWYDDTIDKWYDNITNDAVGNNIEEYDKQCMQSMIDNMIKYFAITDIGRRYEIRN